MNRKTKQRFLEAKRMSLIRKYPTWTDEDLQSFNFYTKTDNGANGLTRCIIDWITFNGGQAERINTMGRRIDNRETITDVMGYTRTIGSVSWQKGTGTKGSADISATIPMQVNGINSFWSSPVILNSICIIVYLKVSSYHSINSSMFLAW